MFTETFREVLGKEGVVAIVTCADGEAHVVNTWNSYLVSPRDGTLLIPAWKMRETERKTQRNDAVQLTLGSKEVAGRRGPGTGFHLRGTARFLRSGPEFDLMKEKFPFATRVLEITVASLTQTL